MSYDSRYREDSCQNCKYFNKDKMINPFLNTETNEIEFPYQPLRDLVFILPIEEAKEISGLIIPEIYRQNHTDSIGVVLAIGRGFRCSKRKKFIPTTAKIGDIIGYDSSIPWEMEIKDKNGDKHKVLYCGERDLQFIVRQ